MDLSLLGIEAPSAPMRPEVALARVGHLLDRALAPSSKVRAYRRAADLVLELGRDEIVRRVGDGTLRDLPGIGPSTASVITGAVRGEVPQKLGELERSTGIEPSAGGRRFLDALRGDCHMHSTWSDGGASAEAMARGAMALDHDYIVLTDHSPRLTVAHGLDRDRLLAQLDEIDRLNAELAPFRILTGIEVDILEDGTLDQDADLLARLDVVVASVHSKLRMDRDAMTRRMVLAVASPHVDILGHCTGRQYRPHVLGPDGRPELARPPSAFDAEVVFAACARFDTAVEINCRPERQDPPDELLAVALDWGCKVAIDTDAHATGHLAWQASGCDKADRHDIALEDIVNTWAADELVEWAG